MHVQLVLFCPISFDSAVRLVNILVCGAAYSLARHTLRPREHHYVGNMACSSLKYVAEVKS